MELVASALGVPSTNNAGVCMPATVAPPLNPKTGAMRHRLPDEGAAILSQFASAHHRGPTSTEAHELVAQIQRETSYEANFNSVKSWFQRRRVKLNLEPLRPTSRLKAAIVSGKRTSRPSWKVSQINHGTVTISTSTTALVSGSRLPTGPLRSTASRRSRIARQAAIAPPVKRNIGGNRPAYPREAIAIFEEFALAHGRYPTADEARELIGRVRNETGYQTTLKSVKFWFYKHRTDYKLKNLVDSSRALNFEGCTPLQARKRTSERISKKQLAITIPPRPSASTIPYASQSTLTPPQPGAALPPVVNTGLTSLSHSHVAILKALQPCWGQTVEDPVISACAETWGVEKGLIEEWLHDNPVSSPLTAISSLAFSPISFSIPLRPSLSQEHGQSPQFGFPLSDPSPPSGGDGQGIDELGDDGVFRQFTNETAEMEGVVNSGISLPTLATGRVINPLLEAIIEVVRDTLVSCPPSTTKPSNVTELKTLWPLPTCLGNLWDVVQDGPRP